VGGRGAGGQDAVLPVGRLTTTIQDGGRLDESSHAVAHGLTYPAEGGRGSAPSDTHKPAAAPRRDVLGFFKSVVEFFTGMTGLAAAFVTLLGTAATIAVTSGALDAKTTAIPPQLPETPTTLPVSASAAAGGAVAEIESTIETDLGVRLQGTGEVIDDISCAQDSNTHATCTAAMSGTGPSEYSISVDIDPTSGLYLWQVVSASA